MESPELEPTLQPTYSRHSYHDSESEEGDFDPRTDWLTRSGDLDVSEGDSWDWTFPNEKINDYDIVRADISTKQRKENPNEDLTFLKSVNEARGDDEELHELSGIVASNDTEMREVPGNCLFKSRSSDHVRVLKLDQIENSLEVENNSCVKQNSDGDSITDSGVKDPEAADVVQTQVVYFEDPRSFRLLRTRLRYLSGSSDIAGKSRIPTKDAVEGGSRNDRRGTSFKIPTLRRNVDKKHVEAVYLTKADTEARFLDADSGNCNDSSSKPPRWMNVSSLTKSSLSLPLLRTNRRGRGKRSKRDVNSDSRSNLKRNRGRISMSKIDGQFGAGTTNGDYKTSIADFQDFKRKPKLTGLPQFRRFVRLVVILLKAVGTKPRKQEESNYSFLSWTVVYDEVLGISRLNYDSGALTFDPLLYKASKESPLTQEVKDILRLPADQRTDAQVHAVMINFHNVIPSFSEFPKGIQQSMIKVCTYDRFDAGRVIIRQGHRAENFYFIISGCAVVTQMDSSAGHVYTTNVLGKGNSFGELAFLHMSKRSATVTCRDQVELLCIERQDFINIFMRPRQGEEPDHITFLKSIDLLRGWPVSLLPFANPKICAFTYVRRDVILCQNSEKSDWIFVVYSGSCKVLKVLDAGPNLASSQDPETSELTRSSSPNKDLTRAAESDDDENPSTTLDSDLRVRKVGVVAPNICWPQNNGDLLRNNCKNGTSKRGEISLARRHKSSKFKGGHFLPPIQTEDLRVRMSPIEHLARKNQLFYKRHVLPKTLPDIKPDQAKDSPRALRMGSRATPHPVKISSVFHPKRQSYGLQRPTLSQLAAGLSELERDQGQYSQQQGHHCSQQQQYKQEHSEQAHSRKHVYVEISRLEQGDIFGLEQVVLAGIRDVASCSLVSEGSEVVLINRAFFRRHLTEEVLKRMRQIIRPLPSEKVLQKKFQEQKLWEAFKAETVAKQAHDRKLAKQKLWSNLPAVGTF